MLNDCSLFSMNLFIGFKIIDFQDIFGKLQVSQWLIWTEVLVGRQRFVKHEACEETFLVIRPKFPCQGKFHKCFHIKYLHQRDSQIRFCLLLFRSFLIKLNVS